MGSRPCARESRRTQARLCCHSAFGGNILDSMTMLEAAFVPPARWHGPSLSHCAPTDPISTAHNTLWPEYSLPTLRDGVTCSTVAGTGTLESEDPDLSLGYIDLTRSSAWSVTL